MYVYSIDTATVASVLGISERSLGRWHRRFRMTGNVVKNEPMSRTSRWPSNVFNLSDSTICRALRFDLKLSRKVFTKQARECVPREHHEYVARLLPYYSGPGQLVFIDETSMDGR
ncbi:hypothetical protein AM588_10009729 [Phytophthora nicotianae]|uniref:Uncharacterized protein n=1 Tax=Phytophthora nicotianae TaxID=4792 RepID=A0A0W8DGR7_PHYNI|nr:hypothetical protein AM588_10009729 [Phytophthora nicotianae]